MQLYAIFEGIRSLGFDPKNIKRLLISHGHYDHVGAAKAIIEHTGAKLYAAQEDLDAIEGRDPVALHNYDEAYTGVTPDEFFSDNKLITQGNITIRTMLTPGHTPGTTSFFFQDRDESTGKTYSIGLHGGLGLNTLYSDKTEDVPELRERRMRYRKNLETLRTLPIDVVCSNHPAMINLCERALQLKAGENPFYDTGLWGRTIGKYLELLNSLESNEL